MMQVGSRGELVIQRLCKASPSLHSSVLALVYCTDCRHILLGEGTCHKIYGVDDELYDVFHKVENTATRAGWLYGSGVTRTGVIISAIEAAPKSLIVLQEKQGWEIGCERSSFKAAA